MKARGIRRLVPRSLEHQTLFLVVAGMGGIMLAYGLWIGTTLGHERTMARMQATDLLAASTVTALGAPMWDFDEPKVQSILNGLLTDRDLVSAVVAERDGAELAMVANERPPSLHSRVVEAPISFGEETIGSLRIEIDHDRIQASVRAALWRHAGVAAVVVTLMIGLLAFIGSRVMRPLRQLRGSISHLSEGDLERPVPAFAVHKDIDAVASAIEGFRLNAIETVRLRKLNDRVAAEERVRVHAAVESSNNAILVLDERQKVAFVNGAARAMFTGIEVAPIAELTARFEDAFAARFTDALERRELLEIEAYDRVGGRTLAFKLSPITSGEGGKLGTSILVADVSERVATQRRIEKMAEEDALTGLPNRRKFDAEIQAIVERDEGIALLMLDLDRFKNVNDTMGHPAGDELLRQVCSRLQQCLREDDLIARLGGDEFAVVLGGTDLAERAKLVAGRMIEAIAAPFMIEGTRVRTGTSVGIAVRDRGGEDADDLVRKADLALYRVKDRARGNFEFHEKSFDRDLIKRQRIERALEKAIENEKLELDYQPQHSMAEGRVTGFEALARWRPVDRLPLSPAEFIPIAEESGLIEPLTDFAFRSAARIAQELDRQGRGQRVAVNLSPVLFTSDPAKLLRQACDDTGCDPTLLEIEVTEAVFLEQTEKNRKALEAIREMGATIALDDFGTGYSSLSTLLAFPVDRLKVDQAFVRRLDGEPENEKVDKVVRAIVDFAHSLDMTVTAEGVETQMQLARLKAIGCDSVQGYLIGRPSPDAHGVRIGRDQSSDASMKLVRRRG